MIKRGLLLCLALAVAAGAGCSAKAKKNYNLKRADKFYAAGQYNLAEIEYLNVLSRDQQNVRAFSQLGQLYYLEGRLQRAAFFLQRSSEMATNDLDLRLKTGIIYASGGRFDEARSAAEYVLERQPTNDEAALLLVETAVKPKDIENTRQYLKTLARMGDRAGLEVALGNLAFREHDLTNSGAAYQRAQTLDAQSCLVKAALGAWYWAQNDLTQAESYFKAAAEASPSRSPQRMQYARFKIQTGDLAGARQVLSDILQQVADYLPAQMVLVEIAASEKKFDEAAKLVARVLAEDPGNFNAMLFSAELKLMLNQTDLAIQELEQVIRLYPQAAQAHYQLGTAQLAANDLTKAISALNRAVSLEPNYLDAILLLAQAHIRVGNINPVVVALEPVVSKNPQLLAAQLLLADAYRLLGRPRDALAIYEPLQKAQPQNPQLALLMGATYARLNDYAHARQAFVQVLELSPDNRTALEQLINLDLTENQSATALQRVNAELAKTNQAVLYLLQAKIFQAETNPLQTEAALLKAIELEPENQLAYRLIAQLYYDTKQSQKALDKLAVALAQNPKDISLLMLEAVINNTEKNYPVAAEKYEKILAINPHYHAAINNLAYLYSINLNQIDRAYELAQQARQLAPFDPAAADTLGWVSFQKALYPLAYGLLKESAVKLPDEPEVQFHFGMASYMMGEESSALTALQRAGQIGTNFPGREECLRYLAILAINPATANTAERALLEKRRAEKADDPVVAARLAGIYQREGKPDLAIAAYEAILQANPNQLAVMLKLVPLYQDSRKAYDLARSAYNLDPENPAAAQMFGRLAYQTGDYKLALSVLQQAAQASPENPALLFDLAQAQFSMGNISQTQEALGQALAHGLTSDLAAEARQMLKMLKLAVSPSAPDQVAEALKADPNYCPALLAQALASEARADWPMAQAAYEKILKRYPDHSLAQKQLAAIYAQDAGKLDQAYALAIKARETIPNDASVARILGVVLVQKGDYSRALNLLKQSAADAYRNDPEVYYYLGTAQFRLKNRAESKTALQQALALKLAGKPAEAARQMLTDLK